MNLLVKRPPSAHCAGDTCQEVLGPMQTLVSRADNSRSQPNSVLGLAFVLIKSLSLSIVAIS